MSNFSFSPKPPLPREMGSSVFLKEPMDLNRNFTNSYLSNQIFLKRDSEVSSLSNFELHSETIASTAEYQPNSNRPKDSTISFNFQTEYHRLLGKYKKKEEKFKKVLIDFQNQIVVKESIICSFERQLGSLRGESQTMSTRQLDKLRDKVREYEILITKNEQTKQDLEYQLQKSKRTISELKERTPEYVDSSKSKEYYVSKLIECEGALRQREEKMEVMNKELVHSKSQLEYVNRGQGVQDEKMNLIKALNTKRISEEELNKALAKLTSELAGVKVRLANSQELRAKAQHQLSERSQTYEQLGQMKDKYQRVLKEVEEERGKVLSFETLVKEKAHVLEEIVLRIQSHEATVAGLNGEISRLKAEIVVVTENFSCINKVEQQLRQDNKLLGDRINLLSYTNDEMRLANTKLSKEMVALSNRIKELDASSSSSKTEILDLVQEKEELREQMKILVTRKDQLTNEIEFLVSKDSQLTKSVFQLKQNIKDLTQQKESQARRQTLLNDKLSSATKEKMSLEQTVSHLEACVLQSTKKLLEYEELMGTLNVTLEWSRKEKEELLEATRGETQTMREESVRREAELAKRNEVLEGEQQQLIGEMGVMREELGSKTQQFNLFGQQLETLIGKLDSIQSENDQLYAENDTLTREIQTLKQTLITTKEELSVVRVEHQEVVQDSDDQRQHKEAIEAKVVQLQLSVRDVQRQLGQEISQLREQLILASKEKEEMKKRLADSNKLLEVEEGKKKETEKKSKASTSKEHEIQLKQLRTQLESSISINRDLSKKGDQLVLTVSSLKEEIRSMRRAQNERKAKTRPDKKVEDKSKSKDQAEQMELILKEKSSLEQELSECQKAIEGLNNDNRDLEEETKQLRGCVTALKSKEAELSKCVNEIEFMNRELKQELRQRESQIQLQTQKVEEKGPLSSDEEVSEVNPLEGNIGTLEQRIIELESTNKELVSLLNYYDVRSLLFQLIDQATPTPPSTHPSTPPRSPPKSPLKPPPLSIQKHLLELVHKIEWMQQNLNFINLQNIQLQTDLDLKDQIIFDYKKAVERGDSTVKEMKVHLERLKRKENQCEGLIETLNKEVLELQLRFGNLRMESQEGRQSPSQPIEEFIVKEEELEQVRVEEQLQEQQQVSGVDAVLSSLTFSKQ